MYNEEQKLRFIKEYTNSVMTAKGVVSIFNAMEKFENEWAADLCTQTTDALQACINKTLGVSKHARQAGISVLKRYVRWCLRQNIEGACDGMLSVTYKSLEQTERCMLASPVHMQQWLDCIFDSEDKKSVSNLSRAYYWLAYAGFPIEEAFELNTSDVDLANLAVHYNGHAYEIYREGFLCFYNLVNLQAFVFDHGNYVIPRQRLEGDRLFRSFRITKPDTVRKNSERYAKDALKRGITDMSLTYTRVALSGFFYRLYRRELDGFKPDFTDIYEYIEICGGDADFSRIQDEKKRHSRMKTAGNNYRETYTQWRDVFYPG